MALNKKGSRRITVDGIEYRWRIRRKPSYMQGLCWTPLTYAVEAASGSQPGTTLVVTSGQAHPSNWVGAEAVPIRPATNGGPSEHGRCMQQPCMDLLPDMADLRCRSRRDGPVLLLPASEAVGIGGKQRGPSSVQ
ncbi:hypothetical protein [Streptomyces sp. SudanB182_2057]|uniref:hypothetical protein n=1 Tax=Streptomyces sp. SudanB182_2057 TaxID=3035281 RepID=UPI003F570307